MMPAGSSVDSSMPEGPEIRRAADALAGAVVGKRLQRVFFGLPKLKRYERQLDGSTVESITPHGKALLIRFDAGWTMYSHNQLYGVWMVGKPGERPATSRSLRVELESADAAIRLYSASDISLWPGEEVLQHPFLQRIGPDVLDPALRAQDVLVRLKSAPFQTKRLSALLLDQAFLAGMGNYLRAEVLFVARLDPDLRPADLPAARLRALAKALLAVPQHSYRARGIEPSRRMKAAYTVSGTGAFRFQVFDRAGEPCFECGTLIQRVERDGRRLYVCPHCQGG